MKIRTFSVLTMLMVSMFHSSMLATEFILHVDSNELIYGVMKKENQKMDPNAVGDKHLSNKAYGLLQIRAPYLEDVNRIAGRKEVLRKWGKETLTMEDMKDKEKAEWAFHVYLSHYGDVYTKRTGKLPTAEVYARIHNGGPSGWKKENTVDYGRTVAKYINVYREKNKAT